MLYNMIDGEIVPFTPEEIAAAEAAKLEDEQREAARRLETAYAERNKRLADSDWTQLPDVPLTDEQKTAWQTYRQELRDITSTPGWPDAIEWPVPPA